ncbi:hypothetical protein QNM99_21685 [Pseudomonas sp. PCH446]
MRLGQHLLHQLPRLALRPIQRKAAGFVTRERALPDETRVCAGQRVRQQYHVQAEHIFAFEQCLTARVDQCFAQLRSREASIERLLAQLQDLFGEPLAIQRRFVEKALYMLAMGNGLGLQALQCGLPKQLVALLLEQFCALLILVHRGTYQRADDSQQAQAAQECDSPLEGEVS